MLLGTKETPWVHRLMHVSAFTCTTFSHPAHLLARSPCFSSSITSIGNLQITDIELTLSMSSRKIKAERVSSTTAENALSPTTNDETSHAPTQTAFTTPTPPTIATTGHLIEDLPKCARNIFQHLTIDDKFSDLKILGGGCEFHAHTAVLFSQSEVLCRHYTAVTSTVSATKRGNGRSHSTHLTAVIGSGHQISFHSRHRPAPGIGRSAASLPICYLLASS